MSNGYIESSLKRFLKRKVKITLGLVVAFMITGTVGFAEGETVEEKTDFEIAKEHLTGLKNNNVLDDVTISDIEGDTSNRSVVTKNENGKTTITLNGFGKNQAKVEVSIDSGLLSDKTKEYLNNSLKTIEENKKLYTSQLTNMDNNGILVPNTSVGMDITVSEKIVNNGLIFSKAGQKVKNNGIVENKGIIIVPDSSGFGAQYIQKATQGNTKIYNYGLLSGNGQTILDKTNSSYLDNRGLILNGNQKISSGSKNIGKNYGVIINNLDNTTNTGKIGQLMNVDDLSNKDYIETDEAELFNYGIIKVEKTGQLIQAVVNSKGSTVKNSKLYNYGLIQSEGKGQYIAAGEGNTAENYGIILSKDYAIEINNTDGKENKGINYGVVVKTDENNKNIFTDDVENRGLVILATNNNDISTGNFNLGNNHGVVVNKDYSLADGQTDIVAVDKIEDGKSTFTNTGMTIEDSVLSEVGALENKNLIAVIDSKEATAFKYNGDKEELFLKDVEMLGYFTGNASGNVLELGEEDNPKNLAIGGDTKIVALNNGTGKVNAVELNGGTLTVSGNAEIIGNVDGQSGTLSFIGIKNTEKITGDVENVLLRNSNGLFLDKEENYTNAVFNDINIEKLSLEFTQGNADLINKVVIKENAFVEEFEAEKSIYDIDMTVENINNIKNNIILGQKDDILTINNDTEYDKVIDGNIGTDTLNVDADVEENIFNYKINNIENINLSGNWKIGENAEITSKEVQKSGTNNYKTGETVNSVNLNVDGRLTAEMNNNKGNGDFITSFDKITSGNDMTITTKGGVKYEMGDNFAINSDSFTTDSKFTLGQYEIEKDETTKETVKEDTKLSASGIFDISQNTDNTVTLRVKSADELGVGSYTPVYEAILAGVGNNADLTDKLNSIENAEGIAKLVKSTQNTAKAYYTAGNVVTKNIVDTYLSAVTESKDKADKGQWIAYGKYINSDTEFDGGSEVKGYDGDITGTIGMLEYGMTENTSYGAVFGKGDTEVDINDGGKLDGDNYYAGLYFKHKTADNVDILGSFGYVKSDLDSTLKNSFEVPSGSTADALVDGTADSKAISAVLKAKKDYYITESLKVQPVIGAALTLITQEEAENKKMGLTISQQDVDVYELITGVNIIKEFTLESGKFGLGTGLEYSWANSNQDRDAKYMLNGRELNLEDSEIASSKGTFHLGADYEHENGVGFNAKYEMMWSDEGDDSRITAGISYRF